MTAHTRSIAEKVRSAFPKVIKAPLTGPDGLKTPWYGLWRMDTYGAVGPGSVSARYQPHTSEDVVALVEAAEAVFGETADVQCGFRHGHFVTLQPSLDREQRLSIYRNDTVFPRLLIHAPYGSTFKASVGLFRIVCSNLYTLKQVEGVSVTIRHSFGLRSRMDELIADFSILGGGWDALTARIKQMDAVRVKVADFLDSIYGQPDEKSSRSLTMHKGRTEAIITRLARERVAADRPMGSLHEASAWECFNLIQGYVQHEKARKGKVSQIDRAILADADPDVRRAEALLMSMAV